MSRVYRSLIWAFLIALLFPLNAAHGGASCGDPCPNPQFVLRHQATAVDEWTIFLETAPSVPAALRINQISLHFWSRNYGVCSGTLAGCNADTDCPGSETCIGGIEVITPPGSPHWLLFTVASAEDLSLLGCVGQPANHAFMNLAFTGGISGENDIFIAPLSGGEILPLVTLRGSYAGNFQVFSGFGPNCLCAAGFENTVLVVEPDWGWTETCAYQTEHAKEPGWLGSRVVTGLTMNKSGPDLELSWDDCRKPGDAFNLFRGDLDTLSQGLVLEADTCGIASGSITISPGSPQNEFFLLNWRGFNHSDNYEVQGPVGYVGQPEWWGTPVRQPNFLSFCPSTFQNEAEVGSCEDLAMCGEEGPCRGACCYSGGVCDMATEVNCYVGGGTWSRGAECGVDSCPVP